MVAGEIKTEKKREGRRMRRRCCRDLGLGLFGVEKRLLLTWIRVGIKVSERHS